MKMLMCHMHFNRTPKRCYSGLGSSAAPADLSAAAAAVSYASPMNSTLLIFDKRQCIPSMYAGCLAFYPWLWKREEKNVWNFVKIPEMSSLYFVFTALQKKKNTDLAIVLFFLKWITFSILTFDDDRLCTSCNRPPCVRAWRQVRLDWKKMSRWRYQESVYYYYYYYHVECPFSFFSCPREIHDKIFACSCVCLPFRISAAVREVNWK